MSATGTGRGGAATSQVRGEPAVQAAKAYGVDALVGSFNNPRYSSAGPPANAFYWRGRDGLVHDRDGNKWDAITKVLLEAGRGSLDQQAGVPHKARSRMQYSSTPAASRRGLHVS